MSKNASTPVIALVLVLPLLAGCMGDDSRDGGAAATGPASYRFAAATGVDLPLGAIVAETSGTARGGTALFLADTEGHVAAVATNGRTLLWEATVPGEPVAMTLQTTPDGLRVAVLSLSTLGDFVTRGSAAAAAGGLLPDAEDGWTSMTILTLLDAETGDLMKDRTFRSSVPVAVVAVDTNGDATDELVVAHRPDGKDLRIAALDGTFADASTVDAFMPALLGDPAILWWWYVSGSRFHDLAVRDGVEGRWILVGTSAALYMIRPTGDHIHIVPEDAQDTAQSPERTVIGGRKGLTAIDAKGQIEWEAPLPPGLHRVASGTGGNGTTYLAAWADRESGVGGFQGFDRKGIVSSTPNTGLSGVTDLQVRALDVDRDGRDEWFVEVHHADGSGTVRLLDADGREQAAHHVAELPGRIVVLPSLTGGYDLWVPGAGGVAVLTLAAV